MFNYNDAIYIANKLGITFNKFTIDDFLANVDAGYIINSDGYGKYHDGHNLTDEYFDFTSDVKDYPYIVWYNG